MLDENPEMQQQAPSGENATEASSHQRSFLTIKEVNTISRARTLRLAVGDVIIGTDSKIYNGGIIEFQTVMEECDEDEGILLTIWRNGAIFNVIGFGPLGVTLEFASPENIEQVSKDLENYSFPKRDELSVFEVLRNLTRRCEIIDTSPSQLAFLAPPLWLIQHLLVEPLMALAAIYAITFVVHWSLFIIAYILMSLYFKRGYLMMLRSFIIYKDYQMWIVIAARDVKEVQEICRKFDPKTRFRDSLVGEPQVDEAPKKKRRRSSIPGI